MLNPDEPTADALADDQFIFTGACHERNGAVTSGRYAQGNARGYTTAECSTTGAEMALTLSVIVCAYSATPTIPIGLESPISLTTSRPGMTAGPQSVRAASGASVNR